MEPLSNYSKNPKILYLILAVLTVGIGWYLINQSRNNDKFKAQIDKIDQSRKSLEDSVAVLKNATFDRDEKLKTALHRNAEIMDTLNTSLQKINSNSKAIDDQIETNKKTIDELWKNN